VAHAFDKGSLKEQGIRRNNKLDMGMTQSRIFMFVSAQFRVSCWLAMCLASLLEACIFSLLGLDLLIPENLTFWNSVVYGFNITMSIRLELEKSYETKENVKTDLF
jgi:hypothetical protein